VTEPEFVHFRTPPGERLCPNPGGTETAETRDVTCPECHGKLVALWLEERSVAPVSRRDG
jgi:hypothetical protein